MSGTKTDLPRTKPSKIELSRSFFFFSKFRCGCEHGLVNQHGTSAFTGRVVQVLHFRLVTQPLWNVSARAFQKLEQFSRTLYAEIPRFNDVSCKGAPLIVVWLLRHQLPAFWLPPALAVGFDGFTGIVLHLLVCMYPHYRISICIDIAFR